MSLKAVFFDMGGTIDRYGFTPEMRLAKIPGIQQRLLSAGIDLGLCDEELFQVVSIGMKRYHQWSLITMEELPSAKVWNEYIFAGFSVDRAELASISEDLACYFETELFSREMRPEVPDVLKAIRQMGLKIGIISNVNSRGQVPKNLTDYKIKQFFDPIVLSSEYGRRKPDPAIFHQAARLAQVPASACVHVGDRIARDVVGAKRAGFGVTVQIRHDYDHGEEDVGADPDYLIDTMTPLIGILEKELDRSVSLPVLPVGEEPAIRAVIFDAGDILYYRPNRNVKLVEFLKENDIDYYDFDYETENKLLKEKSFRGLITRDEYLEAKIRLFGITDPDLIEQGKQILGEGKDEVEFFEGLPDVLYDLKEKGYLLGIVTDTANTIHAKLNWFERGGFGHVWDSIISSTEIGCRKPEPKIYQACLDQLGVSAEEAIFVGHKITELDGARAVGMKTIAFNYDEGAQADGYIESLTELLETPLIP